MSGIFQKLGLQPFPVFCAPLAGVSDIPFRRINQELGASLTYVEMISCAALSYGNLKTLRMIQPHPAEKILGIQVTARSEDELAQGLAVLNLMDYATVDINMGCPVKKVVKTGCGSAVLQDPEKVYRYALRAKQESDIPVSCKIRLGFTKQNLNYIEVIDALNSGGADWITVHGRTRDGSYADPVDLEAMAHAVKQSKVPVIGNGNIFSKDDIQWMHKNTDVQGVMVSRGTLGNPWIFEEVSAGRTELSLTEWRDVVLRHIEYQNDYYDDGLVAALIMRKHLLWYLKQWHKGKKFRDQMAQIKDLDVALSLVNQFCDELSAQGVESRKLRQHGEVGERFYWDPKFEMDRERDKPIMSIDKELCLA